MTDAEIEKLANALVPKIQDAVQKKVYEDAGRSIIGMIKQAVWAFCLMIAAWGYAKYGAKP